MRPRTINLKILLPTHVLLEEEAVKVTAEAVNGSFCLLPRHVDFVSALDGGILSYENPEGEEHFVAIHEGILVKCGADVSVSTRDAVAGEDLGQLRAAIETQFREQGEREVLTRTALSKLEMSIMRRFMKLGENFRG